jgi:hypothetical protein
VAWLIHKLLACLLADSYQCLVGLLSADAAITAAANNQVECVGIWLDRFPELTQNSRILAVAARMGSNRVVDLLLQRGAMTIYNQTVEQPVHFEDAPLHQAADVGNARALAAMLQYKPNVNIAEEDGMQCIRIC